MTRTDTSNGTLTRSAGMCRKRIPLRDTAPALPPNAGVPKRSPQAVAADEAEASAGTRSAPASLPESSVAVGKTQGDRLRARLDPR
jgi:hypothetical protein